MLVFGERIQLTLQVRMVARILVPFFPKAANAVVNRSFAINYIAPVALMLDARHKYRTDRFDLIFVLRC